MNKDSYDRAYRQLVRGHLAAMRVTVQETDLSVYARIKDPDAVKESVVQQRGYIEGYLQRHPEFGRALRPWPDDPLAPPIVRSMIRAAKRAGVGPMAAVAGAVSEAVGRSLLGRSEEVIVENGGDIFLSVQQRITIGIFAGQSPLSLKVGLKITPDQTPMAVCTSSGTIGHSLSYGKADAVCVLSDSCALADAAATSIGNRVGHHRDISPAIMAGRKIDGVTGILIIIGDKMGMWGAMELTRLRSDG